MKLALPRDGEPQLAFDGELLAGASSESVGKSRWTVINIYRTRGDQYIVQTIAETTKASERTWYAARIYSSASELVSGMRDRRRKALSRLALECLESAATNDVGLSNALDQIEETEEQVR